VRLRRADCSGPGIVRRRRGPGFTYSRPDGTGVPDPATLERIRSLAIPPAWGDVWISQDPRGHIQAAGIDAAGRRQYLYHEEWRARRDVQKFQRVERFARTLPALRRTVERDLRRPGMPRERALACAIGLLDQAFFRVGSEAHTRRNGSFGLATIRKSHVSVDARSVTFDFRAKTGKRSVQVVQDPRIVDAVRILKRRRGGGAELLAYEHRGRWRDLRSAEINEHLKALAGDEFSAKDFRTWHATVLAAVCLADAGWAASRTARRRTISEVIAEVAGHLGNTPAVCRASYVDPRVLERFDEGITIAERISAPEAALADEEIRGTVEDAVSALLAGELHAQRDAA
jgi:DNA topoisomerase I